MRRFTPITPLLLLAVPAVALAAVNTLQDLAALIVVLLNNGVIVLIVLGIVVYFYGISTNVLKMSNRGGELVKAYFLWGIIVLFVMVSVWGILQLLQNTLFGGDQFGSSVGSSQVVPGGPTFSP